MATDAWVQECTRNNTPLPLEEMYSYCVCITYIDQRTRKEEIYYDYADVLDPVTAKDIVLYSIPYLEEVIEIKARKISWLAPIYDPEYYWSISTEAIV